MDPTDRLLQITEALLHAQLSPEAKRIIVESALLNELEQAVNTSPITSCPVNKINQYIKMVQQDIDTMLSVYPQTPAWK